MQPMKKRISTAIYMATREVFLDYFGVVGKIALVAVLGIFLGANIFLSETVHPLYF